MECGHESLNNVKVVVGDTGQGAERLVLQEAVLTVLSESSFLWSMEGHQPGGQRWRGISLGARDDDPPGSRLQVLL